MGKYGLIGKYYYRHGTTGTWVDFTSVAGVRVLSVTGFDELGEAVNVYNEQWVNSQKEDYLCTTQDESSGEDIVVRKNVDLSLTLIIGDRYTIANMTSQDVQDTYDSIISTICNGDIYIRSEYYNKVAHVVCLGAVKPTTVRLHRQSGNYILVTIPFHTLDSPKKFVAT